MRYRSSRRALLVGAAAILSALLVTVPAEAQSGRGFLFGEPSILLGVRGGYGIASAGSDIFDFSREHLTLSKSDFNSLTGQAEVGFRLHPRVYLMGTVGYSGTTADSESRLFEGSDDLPILQTTEFRRVPLTAGLRFYPLETGRRVGSFVWVPATFTPYVGAAAGGMWHRFIQEGEFVDTSEPLDDGSFPIFRDRFESSGWTTAFEGFAGVEYTLSPRLALTAEGRYTWADAELSSRFEDFEPIDLSGFALTIGISFRN